MQLNSALLLTLAALPLVLLLFAWRAWKAHDRQIVNGSRRTLFWGGASATVISLLLYIGFALASGVHALVWLRVGFWTGATGVVLCFFGKGKSRAFSTISAGLTWAVWLLFAWAPA